MKTLKDLVDDGTILLDVDDCIKYGHWLTTIIIQPDGYKIVRVWDSSKEHNQLQLSRLLLPAPTNMIVDHANRDQLDFRRSNLRLATPSQSSCNRGKQINNTSGYKGVSFDKRVGMFVAYITVNYKRLRLSYHVKAEDAAKVYDKAALQYHGEFAVLNFPS